MAGHARNARLCRTPPAFPIKSKSLVPEREAGAQLTWGVPPFSNEYIRSTTEYDILLYYNITYMYATLLRYTTVPTSNFPNKERHDMVRTSVRLPPSWMNQPIYPTQALGSYFPPPGFRLIASEISPRSTHRKVCAC